MIGAGCLPGWQPFELAAGVRAVFTGRCGGVSAQPYAEFNLGGGVGDDPAAVSRNRKLAAAACGLGAGQLVWMRQVHGTGVRRIGPAAEQPGPAGRNEPAGLPEPPAVDAIFTAAPDLALGVLVADCAPVLVADPGARIVGAAHAGREGMAAGVVPELIAAMVRAGAAVARMQASIGPLICGRCYELPERLRDRVADAVPEASCTTRAGRPGIDIRAGVEAQLARAGVLAVTGDRRCTAETPGLYSYRRDGVTGRFAGLVWIAS